MYKRILVPLDGREAGARALPVAERLGDRWDAELVIASFLVDVNDIPSREEIIARQTAPLRYRPRTEIRPIVHSVADGIAGDVDTHPDTLVVMATRAHSRLGPLLGSVAEQVLLAIRSPVLLVGRNATITADWPIGPMLVCTNRSETADSIMGAAAEWQRGLNLHAWVIQVGRRRGFPTGQGDIGSETSGVWHFAQQLQTHSDQPADFDVLHGEDPAEAIVDHARLERAGLIALATHGTTGLRRVALGSVAMAVVHDAPCPVLVVKP